MSQHERLGETSERFRGPVGFVVAFVAVPAALGAVLVWAAGPWPVESYDSLDHAAQRASEQLGLAVTTDELCDAAIVAIPRSVRQRHDAESGADQPPLSIYA